MRFLPTLPYRRPSFATIIAMLAAVCYYFCLHNLKHKKCVQELIPWALIWALMMACGYYYLNFNKFTHTFQNSSLDTQDITYSLSQKKCWNLVC